MSRQELSLITAISVLLLGCAWLLERERQLNNQPLPTPPVSNVTT